MPATFPSHQGFVLPLKLWRPTWFDGVGLAVGAALPDLGYAAGCCTPPQTYGHTWWGTILLIPVGLLLSWLIRWAAPTVAAHLPMAGPLALRDYGVLGIVRHRWWVSASSVWLGLFSHVVTDHVTHAAIEGTALGLPALRTEVVPGLAWWIPIHLFSTALGGLVSLAIVLHIGRRRLLLTWHGPAPDVPTRPRLFWGTTAGVGLGAVALTGLAAALGPHVALVGFLPDLPRPSVMVVRAAVGLFLAVLIATAVTKRARPEERLPEQDGPRPVRPRPVRLSRDRSAVAAPAHDRTGDGDHDHAADERAQHAAPVEDLIVADAQHTGEDSVADEGAGQAQRQRGEPGLRSA